MCSLLKILGIIIGSVLLLNGIMVSFFTNINFGNILCILIGIIFLILSTNNVIMCYVDIHKFAVVLKNLIVICCISMLLFSAFLQIYGKSDNARGSEDAVIVLGAGLRGEKVSNALRYRLDSAYEFLVGNPGSVVVVSGGQGNGETITEAEAMYRYLVKRGIDGKRIIREDKSTSTFENFTFSKKLLDENLGDSYTTVFVTNDFHVFRAEQIGKIAGLSPTHIGAELDWYIFMPCTLRECLAVIKFIIFGN